MTVQLTQQNSQRVRDDWLAWVNRIVKDVEAWAHARQWATHRDVKEIEEEPFGRYEAPFLRVRTPNGEVYVDPVALRIMGGGDGRVDLQGWPSLRRVLLIRKDEGIELLGESGALLQKLDRPWSADTFVALARELTAP